MLSFLRQVENNPGETLLQEWLPGEKNSGWPKLIF